MPSEDLQTLLRWEGAGGTWKLVMAGAELVELALLTCDGGEIMGRLRSTEADVKGYVGTH